MIDKSWQWAVKTGRHRTNQVHGEEEVQLVLSETFSLNERQEQNVTQEGNLTVEAGVLGL